MFNQLRNYRWVYCNRLPPELSLSVGAGHCGTGLQSKDQVSAVWLCAKEDPWAVLQRLPANGLAIVGTRLPCHATLQMITKTVRIFQGAPLVLVSGLAFGVDAQVHRAALEVGQISVAVLAGGFDRIYPAQHLPLAIELIEKGGVLVSEHEPSRGARKSDFLRRNRIIAGWSRATWMVEAPFQSGAMNTARWAELMQRDLYATPTHPEDLNMAGNKSLLMDSHAAPLWEAVGFAGTWPGLATHIKAKLEEQKPRRSASMHLLKYIQVQASQFGSVSTLDLQAWAIRMGLVENALSMQLQDLEGRGQITLQNGLIVPR